MKFPLHHRLQPVEETQGKQRQLWRELILSYCRHHRIYIVSSDENFKFEPFHNERINRKLNGQARQIFLDDLVKHNSGLWLDKQKRMCLILWRSIGEWSALIYAHAKETVALLDGGVAMLSELVSGEDVLGTDMEGLHTEIVLRALKELERQGKARFIPGTSAGEDGVKFA